MTIVNGFTIGERFTTPSRTITDTDVRTIIETGGYTHPLFTDPAYLEGSPFDSTPLPGEAALLIMGGLVEQSGRFDDTVIALLGFEQVRFLAPVVAGDTVEVEVEILSARDTGDKRVIQMRWLLRNCEETAVEATCSMLFRAAH